MHWDADFIRWLVTTLIAIAALIIPQIDKRRASRYKPIWGREGTMRGETHRVFNNTGEDAEEVQVNLVYWSMPDDDLGDTLARANRVAAGDSLAYTFPTEGAIFMRVRWKRSSTQHWYTQDLVDPDRRSWRQRLGDRISGTSRPSNAGRRIH
ncbi:MULTISPECIES: hypothetical protein [unclassified Curtobacterium]|uniref:hypothetical protein n=1 Tax=unclassified Curtobacterium TaxID=257496 RepID=UPI003A813C7F